MPTETTVPCHVYMLSNRPFGTLYIGVTSDLGRLMAEHKTGVQAGFTSRYGVNRLVWMGGLRSHHRSDRS